MRLLLAAVFVLAAAVLGLCVGTSSVGPTDVWQSLFGGGTGTYVDDVVQHVRLPRVLLGLLVGAALSISGVLFQALLRNDLAEPYLLGVGPGAFLGVTIGAVTLGAAGSGSMPSAAVRGVFAFGGALVVTLLVFSFARRRGRDAVATILLAGIAIGSLVAAIATGLLHAAVRDWADVMRWMLGDLELSTLDDAGLMAVVLVLCAVVALWRARDLDVLTLGAGTALTSGVAVRPALWVFGGAASLLAALAVALCGQVGFVGLVVPHVARPLFGATHRRLIPGAALTGAGLLVLADALSRILHPPSGLPLGVVTALLGAPVLILLLARRRT